MGHRENGKEYNPTYNASNQDGNEEGSDNIKGDPDGFETDGIIMDRGGIYEE